MYAIHHSIVTAILKKEGRYSNNPSDQGGETYCGISRKFHPGWVGWPTVVAAKDKDSDALFVALTPMLYEFWVEYLGKQGLERCPEMLQYQFAQVAATSPSMAMECLQQVCVWTFPQQLPQSFVDGKYGPGTKEWVEQLSAVGAANGEHVCMAFALAAIAGYARRGKGEQQKFLRGWILRTLDTWMEDV